MGIIEEIELMIHSIKVDLIKEIIPLKFPKIPLHKDTKNLKIAIHGI